MPEPLSTSEYVPVVEAPEYLCPPTPAGHRATRVWPFALIPPSVIEAGETAPSYSSAEIANDPRQLVPCWVYVGAATRTSKDSTVGSVATANVIMIGKL